VLLIIGIVILVGLVVVASRFRMPRGVNGARHGRMSEQWIAEQRTSRRT
jgi:hypothetical protein